MKQKLQWDKKIWDNIGMYLLWCFVVSIIMNYIFNIQDKLTWTIIGFFFLFSIIMFYLRNSNDNKVNNISQTWYDKNDWMWNIAWTAKIDNIKIEILSRKYTQDIINNEIYFMIILYTSYNQKEVLFQTYLYKKDISIEEYNTINNQYNILEKFFLLPFINKSQNHIEEILKSNYNVYIWKEVIIYQNPKDPEDLIMKDPFEDHNS
jgi:hypothetical protein